MLKIAVVQLQRKQNKEGNFRQVVDLVEKIEADVILLPENWLGKEVLPFGCYLSLVREIAAVLSPDTLLAAGAQYVEDGGRYFSRGVFASRKSQKYICYEKHFPSQAVGERGRLQSGKLLPVIEHAGWKMAAVVCVDLFYPEIVRRLALQGCQLILNPVSIPADRLSLWQSLGLVRAAENTIFVVTANNTGSAYLDGREIAGGSFVALPNGCLGAVAGKEKEVLVFELDQELIAETRKRWPYLEDARILYRKIE